MKRAGTIEAPHLRASRTVPVSKHSFHPTSSRSGKDGRAVISIKKYLDLDSSELNKYRPPSPEELVASIVEAYRAALGAMGNSGLRACPALGPSLQRSLILLAEA